nr:hypothetical protein [uncultured Desulfuromonas sp.]
MEKSEINPWDLNDKIHEYHNKTARELWKSYEQMNDPAFVVSMALAKGIIKIEDVEKNCRELVGRMVEAHGFFQGKCATSKSTERE